MFAGMGLLMNKLVEEEFVALVEYGEGMRCRKRLLMLLLMMMVLMMDVQVKLRRQEQNKRCQSTCAKCYSFAMRNCGRDVLVRAHV